MEQDETTDNTGHEPASAGDGASKSVGRGDDLYDKVTLLRADGANDDATKHLIIITASDAYKAYGPTNQEKRAELRRIIDETKRDLTPKDFSALRKLIEGILIRPFWSNPKLKSAVIGVGVALVIASGLVVTLKLLFWTSDRISVTNKNSSAKADSNGPKARPTAVSAPPQSITNAIGMTLIPIEPGLYRMGSDTDEVQRVYDEQHSYDKEANPQLFRREEPQHPVTINREFYMGKYEVSIAEWRKVMDDLPEAMKKLPDRFKQYPDQPVILSRSDAQLFINQLNSSNDGFKYRFPTEAEWEYACRAGTEDDPHDLAHTAWYGDNSGQKPINALAEWTKAPMRFDDLLDKNGNATHRPSDQHCNSFGLCEMLGNVWEWCEDYYHGNYDDAPADGAAWTIGGDDGMRVLRGGSWRDASIWIRPAARWQYKVDLPFDSLGLRIVAIRVH